MTTIRDARPGPDPVRTVTYAIGDIHGRLDLLDRLLGMIAADARRRDARAKIIFTGDYCDRGPNSYGVVERLLAGPGHPDDIFICLRGNHDDLFARAVATGDEVPEWAWYLFNHTLESYAAAADPDGRTGALLRHARFLSDLPLTYDEGTYLFVHAGIRPGVAIADQADEDLLWIRHEFLDHSGSLPRRVVHGHTIIGDRPVTTHNRISIDTGAFRSGILTALILDDGREEFLQAVGDPDLGAIERERILSEAVTRGAFEPSPDRLPAVCRAQVSTPDVPTTRPTGSR